MERRSRVVVGLSQIMRRSDHAYRKLHLNFRVLARVVGLRDEGRRKMRRLVEEGWLNVF